MIQPGDIVRISCGTGPYVLLTNDRPADTEHQTMPMASTPHPGLSPSRRYALAGGFFSLS